MFGEGVGHIQLKFQPRAVVEICDHLCFFRFGQLKHEI
jgi:hypothetical protein